ncbi:MAG: hypothetical protein WA530_01740 [Candidatus Acidiferrum sp.]
MKYLIGVMMFVIVWTSYGGGNSQVAKQIVLPESDLIGCSSSSCSQLWQSMPSSSNAIYPRKLIIEMSSDGGCPRGIVALYDKSVASDEIKAALDQRYGKWAQAGNATLPVKLWRVEPKKLAIQLASLDEEMEGMTLGQALARPLGQEEKRDGKDEKIKQVIYLAFVGAKCGSK